MVFPHFLTELENALRFEMGEVGVQIMRNKFSTNTIKRGERVDKVSGLIDMLLSQNRSGIVFKSTWVEKMMAVNTEGAEEEYRGISEEGELFLHAAIKKIKASIFKSISECGLQEGSSVKKDFDKIMTTYTDDMRGNACWSTTHHSRSTKKRRSADIMQRSQRRRRL